MSADRSPRAPSPTIGWDERQVRMLEEMGVRLWRPVGTPAQEVPGEHEASPTRPAEAATIERAHEGAEARATTRPQRPAASRADVATMEWPALRGAVAGCTACSLCQGRRNTVFGVGHEQAHWMIVGEAPGEQEDREGEPFVGKAGQLLDQMLRAVGLSRTGPPAGDPAHQVFIANVLKCRPPMNRNPLPDEVAQCEPFLRRQVALVRPRVILALGRFAVQALLDSDEPIGRLRGRVHRYQGVPVVVSYHPAYLLRQPGDKARAWDDLCLACEVIEQGAAIEQTP